MVSGRLWSLPAQNLFFLLPITAPYFPFSKSPHLCFHLVGTNLGFLAPGISDWQTRPFHHSGWFREGSVTQDDPERLSSGPLPQQLEGGVLPPWGDHTVNGSLELLGITMWSKLPRAWTNSENRKAEKWRERDIPESAKLFDPLISCVWKALYPRLFCCMNNEFLFSP